MTFRSKQQGNTFVGIVIGLVIGLVIAVIVALAITKGSTPFTDKSGKTGKAAEPTAGQVADPNKPMYGNKEAAREAAKDFAREPKAAPPADPLQAVVDKIQAPAEPAKPAEAAKPADKPKAVAAAAPAAAGGSDEKYIYFLQAGAFREISDAESTRAKLALLGFEANVSDLATENGVLHRVRLGPFQQAESMNRVRSKLSENGVDVAVVRNQK
jgi:cell division protein FtsN